VTINKKFHTLEMSVENGELEVTFDDGDTAVFVPLQLHFHSPSEHTIDGRHYDLEMHIVHKYKDSGNLGAVVGVFFDTIDGGPKENQFIAEISPEYARNQKLSEPSSNSDGYYKVSHDVHFSKFLRSVDFRDFYQYDGSLTTPPCSEGIKWLVIKDVQTLSPQ
jgi:carbonic anhydrase